MADLKAFRQRCLEEDIEAVLADWRAKRDRLRALPFDTCYSCEGQGCEDCNNTGRLFPVNQAKVKAAI